MLRMNALRRGLAVMTMVAITIGGTAAGTASAGKGGGSCRRSCTTSSSTTSTTTAPSTTSTTAAPTTTTTTTPPADETPPPAGDPADTVIVDPSATGMLDPLLRTRLAQWGSLTGVLYIDSATYAPSAWFRDTTTQATSIVDLPSPTRDGWSYAAAVMTTATDLWVTGGTGPITLRHYQLSGSPLPTAATLVETLTFGDADSRTGDLLALANGSIVLAWHQQGSTGPQGQHLAIRAANGTWSQLPALTFMPTSFSDQVLAQHPVDGSVWLFSNPDMWGAVGVAHLSTAGGSLAVDWTDGMFLSEQRDGLMGPDPENPDLAVTSDATTGTLALAYQSRDRQYVGSSSNLRVVSRVAVARIPASGRPTFLVAPVWAERVADIGLVVDGQRTSVTYRAVDMTSGALRGIHLVRHDGSSWAAAAPLGNGSMTAVAYATNRSELVGLADDWNVHVLAP